jgi:undecaprenyl-phosphate 4-deoxy-4-formamido-L-arabinose transferase
MSGPACDISVVIPVYRSAATLGELVARLTAVLDRLGRTYEFVLVDDASPDDSWQVLTGLRERYPEHVTLVQLMRNFGQHNALMCGFHYAAGRYVVTLDDDLQNPPEELPRLLRAIEDGQSDLVYGAPQEKRHHPLRNAGSALVGWFYRLVFGMPVRISSYRIMRRELVEAILTYSLNYTFIDGLLAWNTQRIAQVPIEHHPRPAGRSGYSVARLLVLALNLFTNFSLLPLQVVSLLGLLAAVGGLSIGAYYLVLSLLGAITVPGYASTITTILILGGLQLMAIGIVGEYLGRLHLNVNRKPQYTVRCTLRPERHGGGA